MMTLALLLTVVTGAWADDQSETITTATNGQVTYTGEHFTISGQWVNQGLWVTGKNGYTDYSPSTVTISSKNGEKITKIEAVIGNLTWDESVLASTSGGITGTYAKGQTITISSVNATEVTLSSTIGSYDFIAFSSWTIYYTTEPPIEVTPVAEPAANTQQWTFTQPGSNVVLTPIYAKTAAFATTGSGSEVTTLLPEAAEGVFAGTDAPLIVEGTVAFAGTSTEVKQGTVMYAVTPANATEAPALTSSDWKNTVPTAKDIADGGAEVKVWYYIQGADAPQGEAATLDNTFNNSEPACLTVTVLSNKFDLTLKAANVNTIDATQASKGTVTVKVGDAAAVDKTKDITDGKLTAIKMGSEVKLNTKAGYKFRKVEVKKAEKTIKIGDQNYTVQNGETWKQFITRNQLSGWSVAKALDGTGRVYMQGSDLFVLYVSTDGTTWNLLKLTSEDAPIDTDKQYKWVD